LNEGKFTNIPFVTLSSFEDYGHLITASPGIGSENQAFISCLFYRIVRGPSLKNNAVNTVKRIPDRRAGRAGTSLSADVKMCEPVHDRAHLRFFLYFGRPVNNIAEDFKNL